MFYDYASATGNYHFQRFPNGRVSSTYINATETFNSYGLQLLADFHALRIPFMISGGAQAAWKDINQKPVISVLFNIRSFRNDAGEKGFVSRCMQRILALHVTIYKLQIPGCFLYQHPGFFNMIHRYICLGSDHAQGIFSS